MQTASATPTMLTRRIGALLVIRQSKLTATRDEWTNFVVLLSEMLSEGLAIRALVVTEGGGPDVTQRMELKEVLAGRSISTAVVSDSLKLRFFAAAIAFFNPAHRAFRHADVQQAYAYLELTTGERRVIEKALAEMALVLTR